MVIRWCLLSMGWILLFYAPRESAEFVQGVLDAMASLVNGYTIHQAGGLPPAPAGTTGDGRNHVEIPQQHGGRRFCFRLCFVDFPACLQKQCRLVEDPVAHLGRCIAPGGIQLAGFAAAELVAGKSSRHPFAVFDVGARHRYQKLHGDVSGNFSAAHLLLDRVWKKFNQSQAA
jgi:hypothetical protein